MTAPAPAAEDRLARFASLRRCAACGAVMPPPEAPQVCPGCGAVHACPSHEVWPASLKRWVILRLVQRQFHPWRSRQEVWESLLRLAVRGATPHHEGYAGPNDLNALYPAALQRVEQWQAAGCPTEL